MEYKAVQFKADSVNEDERIISGYASTYDLDQGGDIITKGAFAKTLASDIKVVVLWQHKQDAPIGRPVLMREDDQGLYIEAYIAKTRQGDEALELAKEGIINSMSIGYIVQEAEYKDDGVRLLKELTLLEFSMVTFPMNEGAIITGVKAQDARQIEKILRDAGLSRSQAKAIAGAGVKSLREADQKEVEAKEYWKAFQDMANQFTQNSNSEKSL